MTADDPRPAGEVEDITPDAELVAWKPTGNGVPAPWREGDCAGHAPDGHRTRWCYCRRNALKFPVIARPAASGGATDGERECPTCGSTARVRDGDGERCWRCLTRVAEPAPVASPDGLSVVWRRIADDESRVRHESELNDMQRHLLKKVREAADAYRRAEGEPTPEDHR